MLGTDLQCVLKSGPCQHCLYPCPDQSICLCCRDFPGSGDRYDSTGSTIDSGGECNVAYSARYQVRSCCRAACAATSAAAATYAAAC